jgi:hypothetical protein
MSGISCHVIPEIRSHFHPLTLHFHYDMILQSRHSRIHTHRPCISGVDRFRSCNAIHADASVRSCICPRCIQPRRRGGCRPRYTGVVGPACPSSSTGHPPPIASGPYCLLARWEFGLGLLGRFIPRGTSPALFPSLSFHYSVDCCVRYRLAPWRRRGWDDEGYGIVTWGGRSYLARWRPALSSSLPLLSFILLLSSSPPFPLCRINHPERRPPHTRRRHRPERVTSSDGSCMFVVVLSVAHRRTPTHQRQYPCRCRRIVHYVTLPCFYCGRTSAMAEVRRAAADDGRQRSGPQGGGAAAALWCNKIICFCCILWCRW